MPFRTEVAAVEGVGGKLATQAVPPCLQHAGDHVLQAVLLPPWKCDRLAEYLYVATTRHRRHRQR